VISRVLWSLVATLVLTTPGHALDVFDQLWPELDLFVNTSEHSRLFFLLAGTFVGENALLRFYVLHCVFIPVIVTVLIAIHFWRIRKDGGISGPL